MSFQLQFYNSKVQAAINAWPTGISASFVRIAEQMVVSGPNLGMPHTPGHLVTGCSKSVRRGQKVLAVRSFAALLDVR